ncbi:MAG TPA: DUF4157 domain-containing protein, partial [Thermoanaerobaculia bacterium]|nr:DUF4157 domain-containing protein [Thermoanaerobaculia bacterium]
VAFGSGEYRPESAEGKRLLAHELAHTVQQGAVGPAGGGSSPAPDVAARMPYGTLAGDWIIDNPTRAFPTASAPTDAALLTDAFHDMCNLTSRSGNRIVLGAGTPAADRTVGCSCLSDIESAQSGASPRLTSAPHVALEPHGWSNTRVSASATAVSARHPASDFAWGYWTGGQTRHLKPFWQTVAHEICGHVVAFARGSSLAGARGVGTGHNEAIEGENKVAAEHGVPAAEQRGLDMTSAGKPLPGHRGESFLDAQVADFAHGSSALPFTTSGIVTEAADTIQTVAASTGLDLMVQVEGRAYGNEGGLLLASTRAQAVRREIEAELTTRGVALTVTTGTTSRSRFFPDLSTLSPGSSTPLTSDPGRRADVFLFHQPHSAGP